MSSSLQSPLGWGSCRSGRPLSLVLLTATFLRMRTCSLPWLTACQRWRRLGRSQQVGGGHSKDSMGSPRPSTKTLMWGACIRGQGARQPNSARPQRRRPLAASFSESQADPGLMQVPTQSPGHCLECRIVWPDLQDSKLCPSTSFPPVSTCIVDRFAVLCPGLTGPWVKPRLGDGQTSAWGAQRHWSDQTLLKDISGFGVPKSFPAVYVADAVEEGGLGLACSELELPPENSTGQGASAVLGQMQPSRFLCRPELSPTLSFPLWCCLPPTPLCNAHPSAATLAFIAAWLGLPSPSL